MPSPSNNSRHLRIVVTDDNAQLLTTMVKMLAEAGHAVFAAYDGLSACELAEYIPNLDLVISNTRICNVNAPELITRVRATKPWLAILHIGDALPEEGALRGVPTLSEPFTSGELLAAIAALLARQSEGHSLPDRSNGAPAARQ